MSPFKNILLVSANRFTVPYPVYPIGISYIHTYLKDRLANYQIDVFDFNLQNLNDFCTLLGSKSYDFIGISLRNVDDTNIYHQNSFLNWYKQIVEKTKALSQAKLILGGAGFSIFPELIFEMVQPDFGIKGEGEESMFQLIQCLNNNRDFSAIEGLVYRDPSGKVKLNPRKSFLNSLELKFNNEMAGYYWEKSGMLNIQAKRGCPYNCIYCSYPVIEGSKIRTLDIGYIIDTLKDLYFQKGITYVFFTDSVFNISREYNLSLAQAIIDSGVKINWGAYFSPHNLSYEELKLYKEAGLTHIEFGTESFSDQQLKNYNKHFQFEEVLEVSKIASDLGIFFAHFLILGGYGETDQSLDETFENSKKIPLSLNFPYIGMRIFPHTKLYHIALEEGIIKGESDLLEPVYYISKKVNLETIKDKAAATGKKWIFPDFEDQGMTEKFRARKKRGPLWEYLRF